MSTHSTTESRRDRIIDAALELFAAKGFDKTTTREIAEAAGVAEGLIFHHFSNKESLLAAVFETQRSYFGELQALSADPPDLPTGTVLARLATESLARLRREKRIVIVLFSTAQTNPGVKKGLDAVIEQGTDHLGRYLADRRARGELRDGIDLEAAAFAFLAPLFLHFLIHRDLPEAEWSAASIKFVRGLVATWLEGNQR